MGLFDRIRAAPPQDTPPPDKASGRSGTVNTRGFITDLEENRALRWPQNMRVYDKMRRTDTMVKWMLALLTTPIRAASARVEPASTSDEDREIAAFVEQALFEELRDGWDAFLREALTYLPFGFSLFEIVAQPREIEFTYRKDEAIDDTEVKRDAFVIERLAPRLARTVHRWIPDERDESLLAAVQQFLGDGKPDSGPVIAADRLIVFTHEKEGDDWRGQSLLRPAWKPWKYKIELENLEAIAYERSTGLPVVYPDGNADETQLDQCEDAVKALRQGESVYLMMPGPKQNADGDGWLVDFEQLKGEGGVSATDMVNRHETAMARNVLAEFMRLGHENVGARATADVQQDPYYLAVQAHVGFIEDTVNATAVKKLVDWNYEVTRYPKLRFDKIQAKNVQIIAAAIQQLVGAKVVTPDDELEDWTRDVLEMPERRKDGEPVDRSPTPPPIPGQEPGQNDPNKPPQPGKPGDKPPDKKALSSKDVTPHERLQLRGLLAHYAKQAHPFTACVRDNMKRFGPGRTEAVCATLKDIIRGTTRWRGHPGLDEWADSVTLDEAGEPFISDELSIVLSEFAADELIELADEIALDWNERLHPRRPSHERHVAIDEIKSLLDASHEALISAAQGAAQSGIEVLSAQAAEAVSASAPDVISQLALDAESISDAVEQVLTDLYEAGREHVRREIASQQGVTAADSKKRTRAFDRVRGIRSRAVAIGEAIAAAATRAIRALGLRLVEEPDADHSGPGYDAPAAVRAEARAAAAGSVTAVFNLGRSDEMLARANELRGAVYSSLLDDNTCHECKLADGTEGPPGGLPELPTPNPNCAGGARCRCCWIPLVRHPAA